jgi:hypothetical protein
MAEAFHLVATTGRKRGLTPVLFTQKISEINKLVLSPGTYIILRQVVHTDLKRCLDYVERQDIFSYMTERQICHFISSLQPGRAIVKLADGRQVIVQFYERESQHISHTPTTQAALNRYGHLPFQPACFGAYLGEEEEQAPLILKHDDTPVIQAKQMCEKCKQPAAYQLVFNVLRATAKGKVTEERYKYFCSEHANKQCAPL